MNINQDPALDTKPDPGFVMAQKKIFLKNLFYHHHFLYLIQLSKFTPVNCMLQALTRHLDIANADPDPEKPNQRGPS